MAVTERHLSSVHACRTPSAETRFAAWPTRAAPETVRGESQAGRPPYERSSHTWSDIARPSYPPTPVPIMDTDLDVADESPVQVPLVPESAINFTLNAVTAPSSSTGGARHGCELRRRGWCSRPRLSRSLQQQRVPAERI